MGYAIVTPLDTHASAGVRALFSLRDELERRGYAARMVGVDATPQGEIVVYPEVIAGNPLNAECVVRWTLNVPGYLGGDKEYAATEMVYTWDKAYYDAPMLTVPFIEPFFCDTGEARIHDTAYYGKGAVRGVTRQRHTMRMPEIRAGHDTWPPTREGVAQLLRQTRTLYTYDDNSATNVEALMCGCKVVICPEDRELTWDDVPVRADDDHAARVDAFVEATQARWGAVNITSK